MKKRTLLNWNKSCLLTSRIMLALLTLCAHGVSVAHAQQDGAMDFVLLTDPSYSPQGSLVLELRCRPHE